MRGYVARFSDLFILGQALIFWHFTVKKTSLPLHAERLPFLYIQWFAHMDAICKVGLRGKCVFSGDFLCTVGKPSLG